jgi:hypothetical protein
MPRVLCVAEKPSIAKAVANHLGGQARAVRFHLAVKLLMDADWASRRLFVVYNGLKTTSSTFASNNGVNVLLHSPALPVILSPRTFKIDLESGTRASQQISSKLLYKAQ